MARTTREELAVWANGLKPGDKVIVRHWENVYVDKVKKVTPAGWVITENFGTYSQTKYFDGYQERGGLKNIEPITDSLEREANRQEEKRLKYEKEQRAISRAKMVAEKWRYGDLDYDLACKILSIAGVEVDNK